MPAAQELRYNPETGKAHLLTGEGWKEYSGDQAAALVEAQRAGLPGAIVGNLASSLTMGILDTPLMEASRELYPGTENAMIAAELATGVVPLAKAAGRAAIRGVGRQLGVSERVAARIEQGAASEAAAGRTAGANTGAAADVGDSVGAMAADSGAGVPKTWADRVDRVFAEFAGSPQDLTSTQRRVLEAGIPQRIGFQLLPGQASGKNILLESARSDPIIAGAFDDVLQANLRGRNSAAREVIGIDAGEEFGFDELGAAADFLGEQFDAIGEKIGRVSLPADTFNKVNSIRKIDADLGALIDEKLGRELTDALEIDGDNLMSIRSLINDKVRQDWKLGNDLSARRAELALDAIDNVISEALGPEQVAAYKRIREQWKVLRILERPGAVKADGTLSPKTIGNNLRKEFKGAYGRSDTARADYLEPETREFMDWIRASTAFEGNVADSGTATRLTIQNILANPNPVTLATRFWVRGRLKRQADMLNDELGITRSE